MLLEDESGLGFCLRAMAANGGRLNDLRKLLGMGDLERFKTTHAPRLAQLLRCDEEKLEFRLPLFSERSNNSRRRCYGHYFRHPGSLRTTHPQICSQCISDYGYIKDIWDISLSTCCLEHGICLIDRCPHCKTPLRWNRKGVQWELCGHHLGSTREVIKSVPPEILIAQRILDDLFRKEGKLNNLDAAGLPLFLGGLSLNGWVHLIYACGSLQSPWSPLRPGTLSRCPSSSEAQDIVIRAIQRLRHWPGKDNDGKFAALVASAPLIGLMAFPMGAQDFLIGRRIFTQIFGENEFNSLIPKYPILGQMDLFGVNA